MSSNTGIASPWSEAPPALPSGSYGPSNPWTTVCEKVLLSYLDLLACEHHQQTAAAASARERCDKAASELRRWFDPHPDLGPEAADAMIAWQLRYARERFTQELELDIASKARAFEDQLRRL
jgi:hypothetical protein